MNNPNIDEWNREPKDAWIFPDGKQIILNQEKIQPKSFKRFLKKNPDAVKALGTFVISRDAFANKNEEVCNYLDYFIEFYDSDKDLSLSYANLKENIDSRKDSITSEEYIKILISRLILETNLREKIYEMVEDCYCYDVTVDRYGREYKGAYDFTNDEAKLLLSIAMMMKMVIPPTEHYISTNTLYQGKELSDLMLSIFTEVFYLVGDRADDDQIDILMIKLYKYVEKQILKHTKGNPLLWEQEGALRGITDISHTDTLITKFLISDNFFKVKFYKNIVSFIKSIIETQLHYTIEITQYKRNPISLDFTTSPEGLSNIDKIEQLRAKTDETQNIKSELAIEDIMDKLRKQVGPISEDEIEYYKKYSLHNDKFHTDLIRNFFAKYYDGYSELKVCNILTNVEMIVIAKRLLKRDGHDQLAWLMSSVPYGKVSKRLLRNRSFLDKFKASEKYQSIMKRRYIALKGYQEDEPLILVSMVLNNTYRFVEYEQKELTGEIIPFDEDIISDEILSFINNI